MRQIYLIDNSVTQRVGRSDAVADAMLGLLAIGELGAALPQILEQGFSARNPVEHERILTQSERSTVFLPPDAEVAVIALHLQRSLFRAGMGRAVGVSDLQIAATAIRHTDERQTVTVVHYDHDFDHVAGVEPRFHAQWIVPAGSVA
ncbi:MAG: hypothetical protein QM621_06695 [Aeromicrobium sp.]|uniref:PIN domain-containing protein n=1 Tax=Aeromicrobium sp. TaxID=1871063 RepID=UPI0039E5A2AE